jgi:acyl-CoA thioesterase-1
MRNATITLLIAGLLLATSALGAEKSSAKKAATKKAASPAFQKVEDTPGLPRVLLIGDSISIGYTVPVREVLAGKANVHRIPVNGGPTINGLKNLKVWLGTSKWDVIHFNWGLHDLKYMGPNNENRADPKNQENHQQVPLPEYEKNLAELVKQLKTTGAKLIWCSTTPVPEQAQGRIAGDEKRYNEAAARVMKAAGVPTNDLWAHAQAKLQEIQLQRDVHFTPEGYRYLATQVASSIGKHLREE